MTPTNERIVLDPVDHASATNLVRNPSFEVDTSLWFQNAGTGALTRVLTDSVFGGACGRQVNPGTNPQEGCNTEGIAVTSGQTYTAAFYVKAVAGTHLSALLVAGGSAYEAFTTTGDWQRIDLTLTTSAASATLYVINDVAYGAFASTFYVDGVQLIKEPTASAYFDGDSTSNSPLTSYAWTGTAHYSTSTATSTRAEFDLTAWIDQEGADWGEAAIEAIFADKDRGSIPVDYRIENREVTIPLALVNRGGTTALEARTALQAKAAIFQREGGFLRRVTNQGGTVYADIVDASLSVGSPAGFESKQDIDLDASLSLTCLPDFYQDEITLSDHTETTNPEIVFTESSVFGDYPARVRIMVDEDDGEDQRGVLFGFRNRYYSSANTAALAYQAEALQALDIAGLRSLSGASGGTVVRHGTISTSWTPVLGTNKGGTAFLTHQGTYRLWARVYSTSGTTVQARMVYDVGDLVNPVEGDPWRLPGASNFYAHDFGEIRLDASPVGTHRWQGQIQARGDTGNENFSVDRVWLQPVDEGAGALTAPPATSIGLSTYAARDEFRQTAGTLSGKVLPVGGTWATGGSTVASGTDFKTSGTPNFNVARTAISDAATNYSFARLALAGATTAMTASAVGVDLNSSVISTQTGQGVVARYSNASNFLAAYINLGSGAAFTGLAVKKRVLGTETSLASKNISGAGVANQTYRLQLVVDTTGRWWCYFGSRAGILSLQLTGQDSALATGGGLASGKVGIFDYWVSSTNSTRTYDNFAAWSPSRDAVMFANRSAQLTTDGHYRLDTGGTAYGPVSIQSGDLPRLPVSGLEGRTTEVFLKASRGDFDQLPDSGIDDISARVYYRPSYLTLGTI